MICLWIVFVSAIKLNTMINKTTDVTNLMVILKLRMRLKMMITKVANMDNILTQIHSNVFYGNYFIYK